ncbi:MAG: 16S rRNA (guanine(966)-N(2))-methyltransferase RsmD [Clostridia bacterium]|nr:16S rRNA (guanine(966)-N(2))-methyltransferase RsmD [Clostridia bacterium]
MRIITGSARGRQLSTPKGEETRPTADLVKQGLFSAIQFRVPGRRVLDLFAGSGQLGLEALSRGASYAVFCDSSEPAIACIRKNAAACNLSEQTRVCRGEAFSVLENLARTEKDPFSLIFLDPPYSKGLCEKAMQRLCALQLVSPYAICVCESDAGDELPAQAGAFSLVRSLRYGRRMLHIYETGGEFAHE